MVLLRHPKICLTMLLLREFSQIPPEVIKQVKMLSLSWIIMLMSVGHVVCGKATPPPSSEWGDGGGGIPSRISTMFLTPFEGLEHMIN